MKARHMKAYPAEADDPAEAYDKGASAYRTRWLMAHIRLHEIVDTGGRVDLEKCWADYLAGLRTVAEVAHRGLAGASRQRKAPPLGQSGVSEQVRVEPARSQWAHRRKKQRPRRSGPSLSKVVALPPRGAI
jgi:hypothetical protein